MTVEIKVPSPGESISEVEIANWLVEDGDYVEKDQEIAEVESDKATLPLIAEEAGTVKILAGTGEAIKVGTVVCRIDTEGKAPKDHRSTSESDAGKENKSGNKTGTVKSEGPGGKESPAAPEKIPSPPETGRNRQTGESAKTVERMSTAETGSAPGTQSPPASEEPDRVRVSPVAARMMEENGISVEDILRGLKRITTKEVKAVLDSGAGKAVQEAAAEISREEKRQRMSSLRRKLAQRLVAVRNETAMLTTFNECDMSAVMDLRKKYQAAFVEKHGVKLGFMSFFVKAVTVALGQFPNVNSRIDGEDMVTPGYCDIGIAVQTEKGLMVPVIRNAESLSLAGIEAAILELAGKARTARISLEEMTGGSFTITNGGIFGSMLSTPIINPPQSAILGMHNIQERPVAVKGQVQIRPMMYIALSYDHRIIDGGDSVSFLVKIKELLEEPLHLMFGSGDPEKRLLDL